MGQSPILLIMTIPTFRPNTADWNLVHQICQEKSNTQKLSNFGPFGGLLKLKNAELLKVNRHKIVDFSSGTSALLPQWRPFQEVPPVL